MEFSESSRLCIRARLVINCVSFLLRTTRNVDDENNRFFFTSDLPFRLRRRDESIFVDATEGNVVSDRNREQGQRYHKKYSRKTQRISELANPSSQKSNAKHESPTVTILSFLRVKQFQIKLHIFLINNLRKKNSDLKRK